MSVKRRSTTGKVPFAAADLDVSVSALLKSGGERPCAAPKVLKDARTPGVWEARYDADEADGASAYKVAVRLVGRHVAGSPFHVPVKREAAYAPMCFAEGPGLARATQLEEATFTVHIRDRCASCEGAFLFLLIP